MRGRIASFVWAAPLLAALAAGMSGCTKPRRAPPPVPAPPPPAPPPVLLVPRAAINSGISAGETVWHLRAALNVAALNCRGTRAGAIAENYNRALTRHKAALASAYEAELARHKSTLPAAWQKESDRHMTQVYNFFAHPKGQARFCAAAEGEAATAAGLDPARLPAHAPGALARLEAPFL